MTRATSDLTEEAIRRQLREVTTDEVTVRDILLMPDDIDRFGRPFTARKRLRSILDGRLRGIRLYRPDDLSHQQQLEASLAALDAMAPDEQLYSWTAKGPNGYFSGVSTPLRSISIGASDLDHNPIT